MLPCDTGAPQQACRRQMGAGTDADTAITCLGWVGAEPREQGRQISHAIFGAGDQNERQGGEQRDGREVPHIIEAKPAHQEGVDRLPSGIEQECPAIRRGLSDEARPHRTRSAAAIFRGDHGAQHFAHTGRDQPSQDIRAAAGRESDDQAEGTLWRLGQSWRG